MLWANIFENRVPGTPHFWRIVSNIKESPGHHPICVLSLDGCEQPSSTYVYKWYYSKLCLLILHDNIYINKIYCIRSVSSTMCKRWGL